LICSSAFYMDYRTGKHCEPPVCYPGAFGCTAFCQKTFVHLLSRQNTNGVARILAMPKAVGSVPHEYQW
jgi:hypothetical protein